jgi:hypothetical protein
VPVVNRHSSTVVRPAQTHEVADAGAVTEAAYRAAGLAVDGYADALRDAGRRADEAELLVAVDAGGLGRGRSG